MKIDGRTLDHKTLEHLRLTAVRRVIEDREAPSAVIESLGLCRTSIYRWLRSHEKDGWKALAQKIAQGPDLLIEGTDARGGDFGPASEHQRDQRGPRQGGVLV